MNSRVKLWPIRGLDLEFRVDMESREPEALDPAIERCVADLWTAANEKRGGTLFNGRMVSTAAVKDAPRAGAVPARITEYRRFLAQIEDPALYPHLDVNPLAVTGVIECAEGLLIGKRGDVMQDAGQWEVLPSGGISEACIGENGVIDLACQLRSEFKEEIGEGLSEITGVSALYWIVEKSTHVSDIVLHGGIDCPFSEIEKAFEANENNEYLGIMAVTRQSVSDLLNDGRYSLSDTTRKILSASCSSQRPPM